ARFAPDQQTILFTADWDGHPYRILSTRIDNTEWRPLDLPDGDLMSVARTGELLMRKRTKVDATGVGGTLMQAQLAGGAPRELANDIVSADWGPDGKSIAVVRALPDGARQLEFPMGTKLAGTSFGTTLGSVRVSPDARHVA